MSEFIPGESVIPYAGRVYDDEEIDAGIAAVKEFFLTGGHYTAEFEREFAKIVGKRFCSLVNSGSSANLLAVSAFNFQPGDEILTVAAGFPTTVNPIFQNGLVPIFVDIDLNTLNVDVKRLEEAVTIKTRAVMLAHTLGNPFNLHAVIAFCAKYKLRLIEDCCDALGSTYNGQPVGTYSDISTYSFYPAHHITMGEGGAICTDNVELAQAIQSLRDWGRSCTCSPGVNGMCGSRFTGIYGQLSEGYDHRYVYSRIGYNLKATEIQAAIGLAQLKKLPSFIQARKENYHIWKWAFINAGFQDYFDIIEATENSDPSWFAFPVIVKGAAPFTRTELTQHLAKHKVETRNLFGGNLTKQPAYRGKNYVIIGGLTSTDIVMERAFFLGVYPGMSHAMISYVVKVIGDFIKDRI